MSNNKKQDISIILVITLASISPTKIKVLVKRKVIIKITDGIINNLRFLVILINMC